MNGFGALGTGDAGKGTDPDWPPGNIGWYHVQAQAASDAARGESPLDYVIKDFVNHNATLPTPATNAQEAKAMRLKEAGFYRQGAAEPMFAAWIAKFPTNSKGEKNDGPDDFLRWATNIEALINASGDATVYDVADALQRSGKILPAPSAVSILTPAAAAAAGVPGAVAPTSWGLYAAIGGGSLLLLAIVVKVARKRKKKSAVASPTSSMTLSGLGNRTARCHMKARTMKQHRSCYR
jgi:hypothetical protein